MNDLAYDLAVTGRDSTIVQELVRHLDNDEDAVVEMHDADNIPIVSRYLLCAGVIRPKQLKDQSRHEIAETLAVNLIRPMHLCDAILARNEHARICVIGSESGYTWSFDGAYAAAKSALHRYVETKKLLPTQQLICIAPSIIEDSGMTRARTDYENLERRRQSHPKKRFLTAAEVARLVHFVLYQDEGYLSGQVIRMNGGV